MRAVVYRQVNGPIEVCEVPDPSAPPGGVVVKVEATGLCRSDWHAWAGHDQITLPHIPGHELAGTIVELGSGVQRWRVGDRVTVPFVEGCGTCRWCSEGNAQVCPDQQQPGFTHAGSFAEQVALFAADTNLVALPDDLDATAAAALGCRFATSYRGLVARARLQPGEWVCIVGLGGVGLSAVMIAVALGARVVAVDRNPDALALASQLGAEAVLTAAGEAVHELTGGGAAVSVDAVGIEATCTDAIHSLRRRGRHLQIGLLPAVPDHPRVPMDRVIGWELDLLGSHGMAAVDYPQMLELITRRALDPSVLVGSVVGLDEAARLLPQMDSSTRAGVVVIDPSR